MIRRIFDTGPAIDIITAYILYLSGDTYIYILRFDW